MSVASENMSPKRAGPEPDPERGEAVPQPAPTTLDAPTPYSRAHLDPDPTNSDAQVAAEGYMCACTTQSAFMHAYFRAPGSVGDGAYLQEISMLEVWLVCVCCVALAALRISGLRGLARIDGVVLRPCLTVRCRCSG